MASPIRSAESGHDDTNTPPFAQRRDRRVADRLGPPRPRHSKSWYCGPKRLRPLPPQRSGQVTPTLTGALRGRLACRSPCGPVTHLLRGAGGEPDQSRTTGRSPELYDLKHAHPRLDRGLPIRPAIVGSTLLSSGGTRRSRSSCPPIRSSSGTCGISSACTWIRPTTRQCFA